MIGSSTVPTDLIVLQNMGMVVRDTEGRYTLNIEAPPSRLPPLPIILLLVPRTAFEHYMV